MPTDILLQSGSSGLSGGIDSGESNGKTSVGKSWKPAWLFLFFVLLTGGSLASLTLLVTSKPLQIVHTLGFLLLGYLHVRLCLGALNFLTGRKLVSYTIIVSSLLFLLLSGIGLQFPAYTWLQAIGAVAAFILPFVLHQQWLLFAGFFHETVKTWSYNKDLPHQQSTTFLNSMPVRFKIKMDDSDEMTFQIAFRAPVRMKLGLIFYHMVQDRAVSEGLPITLSDASGIPFQWVFQSSQFGTEKCLDPETGLLENGIRENNVVIVRRLNHEDAS